MNISKYRLCLNGQSSNKMEHYIPVTLTAVTLHVTETPLQKKKKNLTQYHGHGVEQTVPKYWLLTANTRCMTS